MKYIEELTNYLNDELLPGKDIDAGTALVSTGLLDSFGMLDLIFFIKEKLGVEIEDFEIADNNIDTVEELAAYLESK